LPDLRRVVVWLEDKQEELVLLTNNFELAASTIAAIYKQRWQIELFFKLLKQQLKIKTFVGTSANAVRIQIWLSAVPLAVPLGRFQPDRVAALESLQLSQSVGMVESAF
jgi:hypothetical protein